MRKFLPLLLILLVATCAVAQNKSRIVGTVTTEEGAVITEVKVTIKSDALIAREMSTTTNERGWETQWRRCPTRTTARENSWHATSRTRMPTKRFAHQLALSGKPLEQDLLQI